MEHIITPDEFNIDDITFGQIKDNKSGSGKTVYVSYNKKPLVMQLPQMYSAPYGLSKWENKEPGTDKIKSISWSLNLSFGGMEENTRIKEFHDKMELLDNKLKETGFKNSVQWLGFKAKSVDVVEPLYSSKISVSKDKETKEPNGKYPPTFQLKLQKNKDQEFIFDVFNAKREKIEITEENSKNARVTTILKCGGIWVVGNKFGLTWNVLQMKLQPPATIKGTYAFKSVDGEELDDSSDDENETIEDPPSNMNNLTITENEGVLVESSDDELEAKN